METSLKLQLDVRNNARDLQNYMCDLQNWEEEMKRKESALNNECHSQIAIPPPRNKIKRSKPENQQKTNKAKKISGYDYSSWDKFDVEKACAEIDENDDDQKKEEEVIEVEVNSNSEENVSDSNNKSNNLSLIDEAFYEKEMGNQFVKKEQWANAIKCYTNAINLDSKNAIYYANRSLCFLKLKNFKAAETDATTAIQLDKKYVKAYQRRAFVRQALGQLAEAKSDHEEILKLEPKNALSRVEITKIEEYLKKKISKPSEKKTFDPKNMFKTEERKSENKKVISESIHETKNIISSKSESDISKSSAISDLKCKTDSTKKVTKQTIVSKNEAINIKKGGEGENASSDNELKTAEVFKPLPEWCKIIQPVDLPPHKRSKKPLKKVNITVVDKDEDFNVTEEAKLDNSNLHTKTEEKITVSKSNDREESWSERVSLDIPKTAIQFQKCWKILKNNPPEAYSYLKKIPGRQLPQIFENSLESDFFSELITFLASDDIEKGPDVVYDFLLGLSSVKRFSSLTLFMSEADRRCIKKCLKQLENAKSQEEISQLYRIYELKA